MQRIKFEKDPSSRDSYGFDWSQWLRRRDLDVLTSSAWEVTGPDSALLVGSIAYAPFIQDGVKGCLFLSGGTLHKKYLVTNTITAGSPEYTDQRSFEVWITEL